MSDARKTKQQLVDELTQARARVAELETSEAERRRAQEEAQRRAAQAVLIYEVGRRVSGKLEPEALLSEIVTAVRDAFDYYGVMLLLLDDEAKYLTLQSIAGGYVGTFPEDLRLAVGEGMIGHAAATGETQVSGDVSKNPYYVRKAGEITRSELAVPIKSGQMVIGVLDLQSDEFDTFDESDVIAMETLADQVAGAIESAWLHERIQQELTERKRVEKALQKAYAEVEKQVEEQTAELQREIAERKRAEEEREHLQQEVIEAQKRAIQELSTPIIPIMNRIIVMPLIGSIDTLRARDITRALLAGIREHRAKVVILDITGVPIVDSGVASHLNKTIQAARLKGTHAIVTGISDAVAETIVDLGIDWSGIETLSDLQTGLRVALAKMGRRIEG